MVFCFYLNVIDCHVMSMPSIAYKCEELHLMVLRCYLNVIDWHVMSCHVNVIDCICKIDE